MQKLDIANILLYDMAQKYAPKGLEIDNRIISRVVESWNKNMYIFPAKSIKLRQTDNKKYDLM